MSVKSLEVPGGELVLRLEGGFEAPDAWKVHEALQSADRASPVVLDFTRVHRFEDFAISLVAPDLAATGGLRIRVRGLGRHQRRILEYFGVKGAVLDESTRGDAEPAPASA
jgi:anti-anti-sigma regulatory factor